MGLPPNGWFLLGKIPSRNGWDRGYPHLWKPPYIILLIVSLHLPASPHSTSSQSKNQSFPTLRAISFVPFCKAIVNHPQTYLLGNFSTIYTMYHIYIYSIHLCIYIYIYMYIHMSYLWVIYDVANYPIPSPSLIPHSWCAPRRLRTTLIKRCMTIIFTSR